MHLEDEKKKQPNVIPYCITILNQYPMHVVICYLPPSSKLSLVKDYIKVKPRGFVIHDKTFPSIDGAIDFCKSNFTTVEFRKY